MSTQTSYPNIEAFYSENEARRRSPESDYGCWWVNDRGTGHCRVSYVQATGEVYAVQHVYDKAVEVLGIVPPDPDERRSNGLPLGRTYYRTLDRILEGWTEHCGRPDGLAWVRERLAKASPQAPGPGPGQGEGDG